MDCLRHPCLKTLSDAKRAYGDPTDRVHRQSRAKGKAVRNFVRNDIARSGDYLSIG